MGTAASVDSENRSPNLPEKAEPKTSSLHSEKQTSNSPHKPQHEPESVYEEKGKYTGDRNKNGEKDGFGTMMFSNGDVYTGSWHNNKKDGQGKYTYSNKDVYEGEQGLQCLFCSFHFGYHHGSLLFLLTTLSSNDSITIR